MNNIGNVLYVLIAIIGGVFIINNVTNVSISGEAIGISIVVPFLSMAKQFVGSVNQVSNQINCVVMGIAGTQRIFNLMDQQPEQDQGYVTLVNVREENGELIECEERTGVWAWKHPHQAEGNITYTKLTGDVRLYDVDFAYEEGKTVLHNITLYAKPGQKVAFVGATGAGKTTVINLLMRFYDADSGTIKIDGKDITKVTRASLRRAFTMVLQDTWLFSGTIYENVAYGSENVTAEDVERVCKAAKIHSFISRLPEGYNTVLTDNAVNISKGQKQLITIARAMLLDSPMLILDEATSNVDTRTEQYIQQAMENLMQGRTCFVIAHRLSTIKHARTIIVMDHGDVVEQGTHEQLMAKGGYYSKLYYSQFETAE